MGTEHKHTPASIVIASGSSASRHNFEQKALARGQGERDNRRRSNDEALDRGAFGRIRSRPDRDESPRASGRPRRGHLREGSGAQGVTALVPVMECTTLPPWELSANCYNNLLSAGANCYYETNVMIQFFNETGILDTATTAVKTGDADEDTLK